MPLIVMCGLPSSGKSQITTQLKDYFNGNGIRVDVVSEQETLSKAVFNKNTIYLDAAKEKHVRATLKSLVSRLIGTENLVILDALNYIKGYRYEFYCLTKANKCTQCTVFVDTSITQASELNVQRTDAYDESTFEALVQRFEAPRACDRWDSPLFIVKDKSSLPLIEIRECLFARSAPPPNRSTVTVTNTCTNFIHDLDRCTAEINKEILLCKQMGDQQLTRNAVTLQIAHMSAGHLGRMRKQFITYTKTHPSAIEHVPTLYLHYLKSAVS